MNELKFTLSKSVLTSCFGFAKNSLPSKNTNPILKTVLLTATEEGISFRTNNRLSESFLMLKGAESQEQGSLCVDSIISDVISYFEDGDIMINFSNKKLVVSQGKNRHQINWMDPKDFPKKLEVGNYVEYNPVELFGIIKRLKLTLGAGTQKPFDKSYFFNPHEKLVTTGDGTSISLWENIDLPGSLATPYGDMLHDCLSSFSLGEKDQFYISLGTPNAFKVVGEHIDREFIFAGFVGEYSKKGIVAIREKHDQEPALIIKVKKDIFLRKLGMCKQYSDRAMGDGKDNASMIFVEDGAIRLGMKIKGLADVNEELVCISQINQPDFRSRFHPGTLLEAVNQCGDDIELKFYKPLAPFIMIDPTIPNYTYLQAAMEMPKEVAKKAKKDEQPAEE